MQPQELQTSWWMQYGAQPSDNPSELRDKRQKLLLLKEVMYKEAQLCHASGTFSAIPMQWPHLLQALI